MEELVLSQKHLEYLLTFYKDPLFTTGPVFGQCDGEKKYMVHMAQATDPMAAVLSPTDTLDEIDISTLAEHAKQAIRVLPGGMSVLGIFVVGPKLVSEEKMVSHGSDMELFQSLKLLVDMCSSDFYQKGIPSNKTFILLSAKGREGLLECSSCEVLEESFNVKPITFRVVQEITWHEIAALVDLDVQMPFSKKTVALSLWEQLKPMLLKLEEAISNLGITFPKAGVVKDQDLVSEVLKKQQNNLLSVSGHTVLTEKDNQTLKVDVLLKEDLNDGKDINIIIWEGSKMALSGTVMCRSYVHGDADVQMCKKVIKEDILHSLVARLQMHCDSLIEEQPEEASDDVVIHEPPRRMMVRLPCSDVLFSDYLFPGELVTEAKQSLQSLLDVSVHDVDVLHTSAGLSELEFDELNTRTVANTSFLPANKDILQFIFFIFAILVPVIAFFVLQHQQ